MGYVDQLSALIQNQEMAKVGFSQLLHNRRLPFSSQSTISSPPAKIPTLYLLSPFYLLISKARFSNSPRTAAIYQKDQIHESDL